MVISIHYRDMTDEQRLQWGAAERSARHADMERVNSVDDLLKAQANALARRALIGASYDEAAGMVWQAIAAAEPHPQNLETNS
jgi:hypothetical protein